MSHQSTTAVPRFCVSCRQPINERWYEFPAGPKCTRCVNHEYFHQAILQHEELHQRLKQDGMEEAAEGVP